MVYKASDIVKRAKQIADLENSDFISWNEDIALLNEAWTIAYQKLINHNNRDFLAEPFNISRGENILPNDFYQLDTVLTKNNDIVPKLTPGMSKSTIGYRLGNGRIELQGIDSAIVNYYPVPKFLTFTNKTIDLKNIYIGDNEFIVMGNGNYLLTNEKVIDLYNEETVEDVDGQGGIDASGHYEDNTPCTLPDGRTIWRRQSRAVGEQEVNNVFEDTITGLKFIIPDIDSYCRYTIVDGMLYETDVDAGYVNRYYPYTDEDDEGGLSESERVADDAKCVWSQSNGHTITSAEGIIYIDDQPIWDGTQTGQSFPFKLDMNTGYGMATIAEQDGDRWLRLYSVAPDTELNFPSNLYFSLLAYQLAFAYCCKQSKDTSFVERQLAGAYEAFYDTLSNDNWQQQTFVNTYTYRG